MALEQAINQAANDPLNNSEDSQRVITQMRELAAKIYDPRPQVLGASEIEGRFEPLPGLAKVVDFEVASEVSKQGKTDFDDIKDTINELTEPILVRSIQGAKELFYGGKVSLLNPPPMKREKFYQLWRPKNVKSEPEKYKSHPWEANYSHGEEMFYNTFTVDLTLDHGAVIPTSLLVVARNRLNHPNSHDYLKVFYGLSSTGVDQIMLEWLSFPGTDKVKNALARGTFLGRFIDENFLTPERLYGKTSFPYTSVLNLDLNRVSINCIQTQSRFMPKKEGAVPYELNSVDHTYIFQPDINQEQLIHRVGGLDRDFRAHSVSSIPRKTLLDLIEQLREISLLS